MSCEGKGTELRSIGRWGRVEREWMIIGKDGLTPDCFFDACVVLPAGGALGYCGQDAKKGPRSGILIWTAGTRRGWVDEMTTAVPEMPMNREYVQRLQRPDRRG